MQLLLSVFESVTEVIKPWVMLIVVGFGMWKWMDNRLERANSLKNATADALTIATKEIARLEEQLALSDSYDPAKWLQESSVELENERYESSARILISALAQRQTELRDIYKRLSNHYLLLYAGPSDATNVVESVRFACLAHYTDLDDGHAKQLMNETSALRTMLSLTQAHLDQADPTDVLGEDLDPLNVSAESAPEMVMRLVRLAQGELSSNRLLIGEALAMRAKHISLRFLPATAKEACIARWMMALALCDCGRPRIAIGEIEEALPSFAIAFGSISEETLGARYLLARALQEDGRINDALAEIQIILPIRDKIKNGNIEDLAANHYLHAYIQFLKREHGSVQTEIEWFRMTAARNKRSTVIQGMLANLESRFAYRNGDFASATNQLKATLNLAKSNGASAAEVLQLKSLLSTSLASQGLLADALELITQALEDASKIYWKTHPKLDEPRRIRAEIVELLRI